MDRGRKPVQISFDDLNRIRILDPEHFKQTEGLADECTQFNESQETEGENSRWMREEQRCPDGLLRAVSVQRASR